MKTKNTRPYKAGKQMAEALCETAHILYLSDNREQYIRGVKDRLEQELEKIDKRGQDVKEKYDERAT